MSINLVRLGLFLWRAPEIYVRLFGCNYAFHGNRTDDGDPVDDTAAVSQADLAAYDSARFAAGCAALMQLTALLGFWGAFILSPWSLLLPAGTALFTALFACLPEVTAEGGDYDQVLAAYARG